MSFSINNKLIFVDGFPFLISSLYNLVKKLNQNDFKYLCEEFDLKVLHLSKQKGFHPYEYMSDFGNSNEKFRSKEKFYSLLTNKKKVIINKSLFIKFGIHLK